MQWMLENGAQVNATTEDGNTPLHVALERANLETIKLVCNLLLLFRLCVCADIDTSCL